MYRGDGRRWRVGAALVALAALVGAPGAAVVARGQERGAGTRTQAAEIRDRAGLFGADAIASAQGELTRVARESGASIIVETVDSLDGQSVQRVAIEHARQSGIRGLFVLIARKEHKLEVLGSGRYRELLTKDHLRAIQGAFLEGFRRQDYNEGLKRGVTELARVMASAQRPAANVADAPNASSPALGGTATSTNAVTAAFGSNAGGDSPLVARNQVRLTLAGARTILAAAEVKARELGVKSNIAVVDDGGHLIAFERMEGARPASAYTAMTKAATAATFRQSTGPLPPGSPHPDPLLNISLQNAAAASGGKLTTLFGGEPVKLDGQVIGGVGVGGGTGEQDAQVARAGIQALLDQVAKGEGGR